MAVSEASDAPKILKIHRQGCEDFLKISITRDNIGTKLYENGDKIIIEPDEKV